MQFEKQFIPPSCNPQKKHKVNPNTKLKLLTRTNIRVNTIAKEERMRHTKLVALFEKWSCTYPIRNAPQIWPAPIPIKERRQFFLCVASSQMAVYGFYFIDSTMTGTKTPAAIAPLTAVHNTNGQSYIILFDSIRLYVSTMSSFTELLVDFSASSGPSGFFCWSMVWCGIGFLRSKKKSEDATHIAVITK